MDISIYELKELIKKKYKDQMENSSDIFYIKFSDEPAHLVSSLLEAEENLILIDTSKTGKVVGIEII